MDKKGIINLQPHDRKLSGVAIFVPGTTMVNGKKDKIAFMPNLKDKEGNSLVDVDFSKYEKDMKTLSYDELGGVDVNRSKFEFMATKDLGGAGLSIAKILSSRGELKEGDYIMGIMTGGGFGSVDIKVKVIVSSKSKLSKTDIIKYNKQYKYNKCKCPKYYKYGKQISLFARCK